METIKRKNGYTYREKVTLPDGKILTKSFKRKTDARDWKAELMTEIRKGHFVAQNRAIILFKELANNWFTKEIQHHKAIRTVETYKRYLDSHLIPFFGDADINKITPTLINDFIHHLTAIRGHVPKGVNSIMVCFKQIIRYAERMEYLHKNPCIHIKPLKEPMKRDFYLTDCEIRSFLKSAQHSKYFYAYMTAIYTGMRRSELEGLKWDRVNFAKETIEVSRIKDRYGLRESTKNNKARMIPITAELLPHLKRLACQTRSGYVFEDAEGKPLQLNHVSRDMKSLLKMNQINPKISFHDLRHTFASQFMMKGGNLYTLQKILGHSDITMTQRYAHLCEDHLKSEMNIMSFGFELDAYEKVVPLRLAHN
jgi:integrase